MDLEMTIKQGDNVWIVEYVGHDCLDKTVVTTRWARVVKEIDDYFGWYNSEGRQSKNPFYDEDNQ